MMTERRDFLSSSTLGLGAAALSSLMPEALLAKGSQKIAPKAKGEKKRRQKGGTAQQEQNEEKPG